MAFDAEADDEDVMDADSTYGSDLQAGSEVGAAPVTDIDSLCSFGISGRHMLFLAKSSKKLDFLNFL